MRYVGVNVRCAFLPLLAYAYTFFVFVSYVCFVIGFRLETGDFVAGAENKKRLSIRWISLPLMFCFLLVSSQRDILALEYNEFSKKPLSEQRELIAKSFLAWMNATQNMSYTSTETTTFYDKKYVRQNTPQMKLIHHHWLLNDGYRMATEILDAAGNYKVVAQSYQSAFNKQTGEMRGTVKNPFQGTAKLFARIDTVQDQTVMHNFFWSWLTDRFLSREVQRIRFDDHYLFPFLLKRQDSWEVTLLPEEQRVKLELSFESSEYPFDKNSRQIGHKTLILDPQKDFLPMVIDSHWEESPISPGAMYMYKTDKHIVEEAVRIGLCWIPTSLKYELLESSSIPDQINVKELKITDIEFGTVKKSDVEIVFPEGTEVVDAINGISYKTDARGNPVEETIEPLYGLDPSQVNLPKQQPKKEHIIFRLVLTGTGLCMILYALWSMYQKRKDG